MTIRLVFTVLGKPTPKARPRLGRHGVYTPKNTVAFEQIVAFAAKKEIEAAYRRGLSFLSYDGAIQLNVKAFFMPPKSWSKKKRESAIAGETKHVTRPDLDNVVKAIKDGMSGTAYSDDSKVSRMMCEKIYSEIERCEIEIIALDKFK
jgi:Holliday junction resolvase RusA-like endonuclease